MLDLARASSSAQANDEKESSKSAACFSFACTGDKAGGTQHNRHVYLVRYRPTTNEALIDASRRAFLAMTLWDLDHESFAWTADDSAAGSFWATSRGLSSLALCLDVAYPATTTSAYIPRLLHGLVVGGHSIARVAPAQEESSTNGSTSLGLPLLRGLETRSGLSAHAAEVLQACLSASTELVQDSSAAISREAVWHSAFVLFGQATSLSPADLAAQPHRGSASELVRSLSLSSFALS